MIKRYKKSSTVFDINLKDSSINLSVFALVHLKKINSKGKEPLNQESPTLGIPMAYKNDFLCHVQLLSNVDQYNGNKGKRWS